VVTTLFSQIFRLLWGVTGFFVDCVVVAADGIFFISADEIQKMEKIERNSALSAQKPSEDYRTICSDFQGFSGDFFKKKSNFSSSTVGEFRDFPSTGGVVTGNFSGKIMLLLLDNLKNQFRSLYSYNFKKI